MGDLSYILQQTINALSLGSIYALVAIGLSMVFGVLRLVNFAHGDLMMVSCYTSFFLVATGLNLGVFSLLIISIFVATIFGILMERIAYRPVRGANEVITLLTSLAVSIFIQNVFVMFASPVPRSFRSVIPPYLSTVNHFSGGIIISNISFVIFGVTILLFISLHLFLTCTKLGISTRATSEDLMAAELSGININIPIVTAFAIGSSIAGLAGILWAVRIGQIDPLMGFSPLLKSFVAIVIGGMGSLPGAILGSYLLGFSEIFLVGFLPPELSSYRDAFVFLLLIIVLLLKPSGIFGSNEKEKV